ncbi:MAG: cupredoxin domain-containing protein [Candidatus Binataceae bacterium]
MMKKIRSTAVALALFALALLASSSTPARAADAPRAAAPAAAPVVKDFTLVSVLVNDVKFWLPGAIVVHQGDRVRLKLRNVVPGQENQHGFSIPEYNITELVTRGQDKTVEFTADKAGLYRYVCQIHAPHVGGELVVTAEHRTMKQSK